MGIGHKCPAARLLGCASAAGRPMCTGSLCRHAEQHPPHVLHPPDSRPRTHQLASHVVGRLEGAVVEEVGKAPLIVLAVLLVGVVHVEQREVVAVDVSKPGLWKVRGAGAVDVRGVGIGGRLFGWTQGWASVGCQANGMAASTSTDQQHTHGCPQSTPTLDSSAAFMASRGRTNTLGTESMAAMDRISLEHLNSGAATIILDSCGSRGNSAITEPT